MVTCACDSRTEEGDGDKGIPGAPGQPKLLEKGLFGEAQRWMEPYE